MMVRACLAWLTLLLAGSSLHAVAGDGRGPDVELVILTDQWRPYISADDPDYGVAGRVMKLVAAEMEAELTWRHLPYDLAFDLVASNRAPLAFPYFRTEGREARVTFSQPVFSATSRIYYNRREGSPGKGPEALQGRRLGKVSGYSYGMGLDALLERARIFPSEREALAALLDGSIDLLPMTERVMEHMLREQFPDRGQLIVPVDGLSEESPLHVVAPRSPEGAALIARINAALASLEQRGIALFDARPAAQEDPPDLARLVTAESYPVVIARDARASGKARYFTLPAGTRALVLEWSPNITRASDSDRLYRNMMESSRVLVLNGPHIGKEVFVRNLHIELQ